MTEASIILLKSKSEKKHNVLLKCNSFQCLFCLTSVNLFLKNREQIYASKFFLQWHTDWCHFNKFKSDKKLPCFNKLVCAEVMLKGKMHFKNHAAQIHDFFLWVNNTWHQECIWDDLRCEITKYVIYALLTHVLNYIACMLTDTLRRLTFFSSSIFCWLFALVCSMMTIGYFRHWSVT